MGALGGAAGGSLYKEAPCKNTGNSKISGIGLGDKVWVCRVTLTKRTIMAYDIGQDVLDMCMWPCKLNK